MFIIADFPNSEVNDGGDWLVFPLSVLNRCFFLFISCVFGGQSSQKIRRSSHGTYVCRSARLLSNNQAATSMRDFGHILCESHRLHTKMLGLLMDSVLPAEKHFEIEFSGCARIAIVENSFSSMMFWNHYGHLIYFWPRTARRLDSFL